MPDLLIKDISVEDKERLRVQAAKHGHSMQEELRGIIHNGLYPVRKQSFYTALKDALDGLEDEGFAVPARQAPRAALEFE